MAKRGRAPAPGERSGKSGGKGAETTAKSTQPKRAGKAPGEARETSAKGGGRGPAALGLAPTKGARRGGSTIPLIADVLRPPTRYLRSIHLERDFNDVESLRQYVVTPAMQGAFARVFEGLRAGSGRRAWRITGDYGSGKSSFALVLAHLLRDASDDALLKIRKAVDFRGAGVGTPHMLPLLVTGTREGIVPAVARAVQAAVEQLRKRHRGAKPLVRLAQLSDAAAAGDAGALLTALDDLAAFVTGAGDSGVLLVLDEMGKFLEYAALHPDREDLSVLQRLAEAAARSGDRPLIVVGIMHQGFHAYAERIPLSARQDWEKVAERFDEIVFDQPLAHTAALVSGALNVDAARLPEAVARSADAEEWATMSTGWYGRAETTRSPGAAVAARGPASIEALRIYPVHPTVLPVLVRFFARFGQHERSLFGFLLSSEPFALQTFAADRAAGDAWYRLSDFYDYVRAVFGHRLAGASYRGQWLRTAGVVDGATDATPTELRVLKTVAILNVLDAEHLLATNVVLAASVEGGATAVAAAVAALKRRGLLYDRGAAGGFCLWPSTSVNIENAFAAAQRALGRVESVSSLLKPFLDARPLLARRHAIVTGTLRYFDVRYADVAALREAIAAPTEADGVVVVALCDSEQETFAAQGIAVAAEARARPDVLVVVTEPLRGMAAEVQDARCWLHVAENTPELVHDAYVASEVNRQVVASRRALADRLAEFTGLPSSHGGASGRPARDAAWTRAGNPIEITGRRSLFEALSSACDELYPDAPRVRNELLNRRTLSSPAAAARMRLIERMFVSPDRPLLGMDTAKAPPEKSMYLSVLAEGGLHRQEDGRFVLGEPPAEHDPLHLRPALQRMLAALEAAGGHRVPVAALIAALRERPFGVRLGVIPLLLGVVATTHAHELAVYENGTFLQHFGASDFLRLTKLPTAFEFQLCRVTGVRAEVFHRLSEAFAGDPARGRAAELLDVVTPLCVFAAQLPESTRKGRQLPSAAVAVRDALLATREPGPLLFHELPLACGFAPFSADEPADPSRVRAFVVALRAAMDDLRGAYPALLARVVDRTTRALEEPAGPTGGPRDREHLADRAGRVAMAAREPRLRTFALRLADVALPEDAWAEALGSFVAAKPPARWTPADEARAGDEIDVLAAGFRRLEAVAFTGGAPGSTAVRIGVTRADGTEAVRVVHTRPEDEHAISDAVHRIVAALPAAPDVRLAALSRLLWPYLEAAGGGGDAAQAAPEAVARTDRAAPPADPGLPGGHMHRPAHAGSPDRAQAARDTQDDEQGDASGDTYVESSLGAAQARANHAGEG